jgi:preprotein translocase subunit SecY
MLTTKAKANYSVDLGLFLTGLFEVVSGFVLWLILPKGGGKQRLVSDVSFLWARDTWITLHDWVGVAFLVLLIVHLALHWRWITRMTKELFRRA